MASSFRAGTWGCKVCHRWPKLLNDAADEVVVINDSAVVNLKGENSLTDFPLEKLQLSAEAVSTEKSVEETSGPFASPKAFFGENISELPSCVIISSVPKANCFSPSLRRSTLVGQKMAGFNCRSRLAELLLQICAHSELASICHTVRSQSICRTLEQSSFQDDGNSFAFLLLLVAYDQGIIITHHFYKDGTSDLCMLNRDRAILWGDYFVRIPDGRIIRYRLGAELDTKRGEWRASVVAIELHFCRHSVTDEQSHCSLSSFLSLYRTQSEKGAKETMMISGQNDVPMKMNHGTF
ncbi:hypothetical protein MA16_Dca004862 [Dendrobium catenatum]|uniref:Uncharacterized protein n=1 Tax=Dendrobium catenatum TaxID=906689 RepID=A0A2I0WG90_9ASPA|nr:hypothetical protein MA16_Dca004862 [Dendrobium catenatum]